MSAIFSKTKAPLKHSDSMHFKFLLAHSWQPEEKLLNGGWDGGWGVKHSHQQREEREGSKVYLPLQWPWKQPKMKGAIWLAEQTIGSSLILPWMEHFAQLQTQYTFLLMGHLCSLITYTHGVKVGMECHWMPKIVCLLLKLDAEVQVTPLESLENIAVENTLNVLWLL